MTNKTLVRVRVGVRVRVRAWFKIYIRHTENTELLPYFVLSAFAHEHSILIGCLLLDSIIREFSNNIFISELGSQLA